MFVDLTLRTNSPGRPARIEFTRASFSSMARWANSFLPPGNEEVKELIFAASASKSRSSHLAQGGSFVQGGAFLEKTAVNAMIFLA